MSAPHEDPELERLRVRAEELGLQLEADDLAELLKGWQGMQRQLAIVREGLMPEDRPPRPTLPQVPHGSR